MSRVMYVPLTYEAIISTNDMLNLAVVHEFAQPEQNDLNIHLPFGPCLWVPNCFCFGPGLGLLGFVAKPRSRNYILSSRNRVVPNKTKILFSPEST